MKKYFVTTQTSVNQCLLHSIMKASYEADTLAEAEQVFDKEVEVLGRTYQTIDQLTYSPTDAETMHAYYCSITAIDDEDPDKVEYVKDSDYFYE